MDRRRKFTSINRKSGPINTLTSGNSLNYSSNSLITIDSRPNDLGSNSAKSSDYSPESRTMISTSTRINNKRMNKNNGSNMKSEERKETPESISLTDDEIHQDLLTKMFKINKLITKSGDGAKPKIEIFENIELDLQITNSSLKITDALSKTKINVPYHRITYIKFPEINKTATISRILFVLKEPIIIKLQDKQKEIVELCINLKFSWNMDELKENLIYNEKSNIDRPLKLKVFSIQEATDYCDSLPFVSKSADNTFKSLESSKPSSKCSILSATSLMKSMNRYPNKFSDKSTSRPTKKSSNMEPDMSSLNRKERLHRTRSTVLYQNEDLEEEMANEQMVMDNGDVKISDYIPPERQIYFQPNLKYKLNNKKTFTITNDDFKCLYNGNWINDTLVDFFMSYSLEIARHSKVPKSNKIEILNSFFFTSLSRPIDDDNYYQNVKSWFKSNNDLFDQEYVIIPIMQDLHWYFVIITDLKFLKRKHLKLKEKLVSGDESDKNDENNETSETNNKNNKNNKNDTNNQSDENENDEKAENKVTVEIENNEVNEEFQKDKGEKNAEFSAIVSLPIENDKLEDENNDVKMPNDQTTNAGGKVKLTSQSSDDRDEKDTHVKNLKVTKIDSKKFTIDPREDFEDPEKPDKQQARTAQICILDSLRRNHEQAITYLKHFIIGYASEKYNIDIKANEISKKVCLVPQQKNFNDCGVHVLFNVDTMLNDPVEFNRVILKRSTSKKNIAKAKIENKLFFDSNRRLYLRDRLRDLLLNLLKIQVHEQGGNADEVGTLTVQDKELSDLRSGLIKNEIIDDEDGDNKNNASKSKTSKTQKNTGNDDYHESDDDLMIIHVEEKEPIKPEIQLDKVIPATEPLKLIRGRGKPKSVSLQKSKSEPIISKGVKLRTSPRKVERKLIGDLSDTSSDTNNEDDSNDQYIDSVDDIKDTVGSDYDDRTYKITIGKNDRKPRKNTKPPTTRKNEKQNDNKENQESASLFLTKDLLQVKIPRKRGRPSKNIQEQPLAKLPSGRRGRKPRTNSEDELSSTPLPTTHALPIPSLTPLTVPTQPIKRKYKKRKITNESDTSNYEKNVGTELLSQDSYSGSPTRYNYPSNIDENVNQDPHHSKTLIQDNKFRFKSMILQEDIENELNPSQTDDLKNIIDNNDDGSVPIVSSQNLESQNLENKEERTPERNPITSNIDIINDPDNDNQLNNNDNSSNSDDYALSPIILTGKVDPVYSVNPTSSSDFTLKVHNIIENRQNILESDKPESLKNESSVRTGNTNIKNMQHFKSPESYEKIADSLAIDIPMVGEVNEKIQDNNEEKVVINCLKISSVVNLDKKRGESNNLDEIHKANISTKDQKLIDITEDQNDKNIAKKQKDCFLQDKNGIIVFNNKENESKISQVQNENIGKDRKDSTSKSENKYSINKEQNDNAIKNYNFRGTTVATNPNQGFNSTNPIALDGPQDSRFVQNSENIQKQIKKKVSKKDLKQLSQKLFSKPNDKKLQRFVSSVSSSVSLIPPKSKERSLLSRPKTSSKFGKFSVNSTRSGRRTRSQSPIDSEAGRIVKSTRREPFSNISTRSKVSGADLIIQQVNNTKKKLVSKENQDFDIINFKGAHESKSYSSLSSFQFNQDNIKIGTFENNINNDNLPVFGLADDDDYTRIGNYLKEDTIIIVDDDEPSPKFED